MENERSFDGRRHGGCRAVRPRELAADAAAGFAAHGDRGVPRGDALGEERGEFGGMGLEERGGVRRGGVEDDGHVGAGDRDLDGGSVEDGGLQLDADFADAARGEVGRGEDLGGDGIGRLDERLRGRNLSRPAAAGSHRRGTQLRRNQSRRL